MLTLISLVVTVLVIASCLLWLRSLDRDFEKNNRIYLITTTLCIALMAMIMNVGVYIYETSGVWAALLLPAIVPFSFMLVLITTKIEVRMQARRY